MQQVTMRGMNLDGVNAKPCGAAPGADGVKITSWSAMVSASTCRARLAVRRAAS